MSLRRLLGCTTAMAALLLAPQGFARSAGNQVDVAANSTVGVYNPSVADGATGNNAIITWRTASYVVTYNLWIVNSAGYAQAIIKTNGDNYTLYSVGSNFTGLGRQCTQSGNTYCLTLTGSQQSLMPTINTINGNRGICCNGNGSLFITVRDLGYIAPNSSDIDTSSPSGFDAANLGSSVNPKFAGGTLFFSQSNQNVSQNFTLNNSANNAFDLKGNSIVLRGDISDDNGNAGSIRFTNSTTGGNVTLTGTITNTGTTRIENGTFVNLNGTGRVNTTGNYIIDAGGSYTIVNGGVFKAGGVQNNGTFTINAGATFQDDLNNTNMFNNSGTATAVVASNTGTILNQGQGTWTGDVQSNAGTINNLSTWTGALTNSPSGSVANSGLWTGNVNNSGTVTNTGTFDGTFANSGTANLNGGTITGLFTNTGIANISGANTFTGGTVNSGTLAIAANGSASGTVTNQASGQVTNAGTLSGAITNAGTLTNTGTLSSTLANSGTANLNGGTITGLFTNTGIANISGANTFTGGTVNSGTLAIAANGSASGTVTNQASGQVTNAGTLSGAITNAGTLTNTGTLSSTLANSGTANLNGGTITGLFTNTGIANISGANTFTGGTVNSGTLAIAANGSASGTVTNQASGQVTNAGTLSGAITNAGTLTNTGTLSGALLNTKTVVSSGSLGLVNNLSTLTLNGGTGTNAITNQQTGVIKVEGGSFTLAANKTITNAGSLLVQNQGNLTALGGINNSGTLYVQAGSKLVDDLTNSWTVSNEGTIVANVASNSGVLSNYGTWTGSVNTTAMNSWIYNYGTWTGNLSNNGYFYSEGTWAGNISNAGQANITGNLQGTLTNTGTLRIGLANAAANLTAQSIVNNGQVALLNTGTRLNLTQGLSGTGLLTFAVNTDTSASARIITNSFTGTQTIRLINSGTRSSYLKAPIVLISAASGNGVAQIDQTDAPTVAVMGMGASSYKLTKTANGDWAIASSLNTAGLSHYGTVLSGFASSHANRTLVPVEQLGLDKGCSDKATENCWSYTAFGSVDAAKRVSKSWTNTNSAYSNAYTDKQDLSRTDTRFGFAANLANVSGSQYGMHLGLIGGYSEQKGHSKTDHASTSDLTAPSLGGFAGISRHNHSLTLQVERTVLRLKMTQGSLGVQDQERDGRLDQINLVARGVYNWGPVKADLSVASLNSHLTMDALDLGAASGQLLLKPYNSHQVRLGGRFSTEVKTPGFVLNPFVDLSGTYDASKAVKTLYQPDPSTNVNLIAQNGQHSGKISLGTEIRSITPSPITGYIRADAESGERVRGYGFKVGLNWAL